VETGEGDQVGLELVQVNVQLSVEAKGGGHRGDGLGDDLVDVLVGRASNAKAVLADIVGSLVVKDHGDLGEVQEVVGGQEGVVGLDDGGRDLGARVDLVSDLGLLAEVNRETLKKDPSVKAVTDVLKLAGEKWKVVDAATKAKYEKLAEAGKAKYEKDIAAYKASKGDDDDDDDEE